MSFLETVRQARAHLQQQGRVSLRALEREFDLDAAALEELASELVEVQEVAAREGAVLSWIGDVATDGPSAEVAPIAGERRQLTVMFCDLVESTALGHSLDPEELSELLNAYQSVCAEAVRSYDGHVAQYLGDGILVYFGYPQAHEDDVERALRAGLEIQQGLARLREDYTGRAASGLVARIGVHTGPVVVSEMGSGAHRETLAVGDTTNVAARIQATASPGALHTSEQTLRLVPGMFVTRDHGTPALKGVSGPLRVFEVLQASGSRNRLARAESLAPLVARSSELELLLERWRAAQEGLGQVVLISGEAGLGKSRLLHALRERLAGEPHTWLEGSCSPFTSGSAFQPVLTLLRQSLRLADDERPESVLAKLESSFEAVDGIAPSAAVPYIASLLELPASARYPMPPVSPELQRERTFDALIRQLLAAAELQPVISVYEDLHWADPSTLELLERTVMELATSRVLLVLTFRTGFDSSGLDRSHTTPIALARLTREQTAQLVETEARGQVLPEAVVTQIVARSDGVPLFVEELTRAVVEAGAPAAGDESRPGPPPELAVPATLQDSLMARLDRLSSAKQVAQTAAVLGRDFDYSLLARVAECDEGALRSSLQQLADAEIVYRRGAIPDATYSFKHALLHDTAYQSLLRSTRQRLHARVADVLEQEFPERVEREPEALAQHFRAAEQVDRAAEAFQRAGEQAVARLANEEAASHFRESLRLLASGPADAAQHQREIAVRLALGSSLTALRGFADPEVLATYERVEALAESVGEGPQQLLPTLGLASFYAQQGNAVRWQRYGNRVKEALDHLERARSIAAEIELPPLAAAFELHLPTQVETIYAAALGIDGQFDRCKRSCEENVMRARSLDHPYTLGGALMIGAVSLRHLKEKARTAEFATEAVEIAQEYGFHSLESGGLVSRGWASGASGIEDARLGLERAAATGSMAALTDLHFTYADLLARCDRWDEASLALELASEVGRRAGDLPSYASQHATLRAECARRSGASDEDREAIFQEALSISSRNGRLLYQLDAATGLARLWQETGRSAEARSLLSELCNRFSEGFATPPLANARSLLAELG